jgi:hypothetical protein
VLLALPGQRSTVAMALLSVCGSVAGASDSAALAPISPPPRQVSLLCVRRADLGGDLAQLALVQVTDRKQRARKLRLVQAMQEVVPGGVGDAFAQVPVERTVGVPSDDRLGAVTPPDQAVEGVVECKNCPAEGPSTPIRDGSMGGRLR